MPCIQMPRVSTETETGAEKGWRAPAEEGLAHGEVALLLGLNARTEVGADLGRPDFEQVIEVVAEEERMSATCDMGGAGGRATDRPNAVLPRPTTRSALKTAEMRVRGHRSPVRELDYSEAAPVEDVRQVGGSVRALVDAGHGMWQAESRRVRRSYYHGEPSVRVGLEQTWAA
jgi:hypothetical protein